MPEQRYKYLDLAALAKTARLNLVAKGVVEGFVTDLHRSPYHGFSVEFAGHREHVHGDNSISLALRRRGSRLSCPSSPAAAHRGCSSPPSGCCASGTSGRRTAAAKKAAFAAPRRPRPGDEAAELFTSGPEQQLEVVELFVSGEAEGRRKLDLRANTVGTATFAYEPPQSGLADIEIRLPDDPLRIDDRRHYKLQVKEQNCELIVKEAASAVDFLDQSYFLERALDPSITLGGPSASVIRTSRMQVKDLNAARLAGQDVVFLLGVRAVPDGAAAALRGFVHRGGGLIVLAGEELDATSSRQFGEDPEALLPLGLLPIDRTEPDRARCQQIASADESHFVFAPFRGLNILKAVRVYKSARIDLHAATPDTNEAVYADAFTPGYYTYTTEGGVSRRGAFVVNPDTAESDLSRVSAGEPEQHLAPSIVRVLSSIDEMEELVAPLREGVHLRDLFIVLTITLAVFETVISDWMGPRSEGGKKPSLAVERAEEEASGHA